MIEIVKKILYKLVNEMNFLKGSIKIKKEISKGVKKAFVLGAPFHSNMGDQAQTYCTERWINKHYPEYKVIICETAQATKRNFYLLRLLKKHIKVADKVFLHSGYHTTDLYMLEENLNRRAIELFQDNQIIVLPQTIYFKNKKQQFYTSDVYSKHKNVLFLARDEVSFKSAQEMFPKARVEMFPDIVTTLIGTKQYHSKRDGILFCMRNDIEAFYKKDVIETFMKEYSNENKVDLTDTTIQLKAKFISKNREKVLEDIFEEYSRYKVIVTDRYHGTIFSQIAATPVVVLSSTDHKLSSGVKWFPKEFSEYVHYASDLDEARDIISRILNTRYEYSLPPYFNEKYYDHLKSIIEGEHR